MSEIRACPALNRLVAEKVRGWRCIEGQQAIADYEGDPSALCVERYHRRRIWVSEKGMEACEECGSMPAWSSDPGEALRLLVYARSIGRYLTLYPIGVGWTCHGRNSEESASQAQIYPTPELAIVCGVLATYGVPLSDIQRACVEAKESA